MDRLKQNQTVICIKVDGPVQGVRRLALNSTSSLVFFNNKPERELFKTSSPSFKPTTWMTDALSNIYLPRDPMTFIYRHKNKTYVPSVIF